ncbi:hypothetical protein V2G26_017305 [Clonostachys chloroleuca]
MDFDENLFGDISTEIADTLDSDALTLPPLDFDSSTLSSNHESPFPVDSTFVGPQSPGWELNTQELQDFISADPFSFQSQHPEEPNKHTPCVDESLLHQIIFRLNELEAKVSASNAEINNLSSSLGMALPKLLTMGIDFREAVENLKQSLKTFMEGMLGQILGVDVGDNHMT